MSNFTLKIETDTETNEEVLIFPPELIKELGWEIGDTLIWITNEDGSISLKKENSK